MKAENPFRRWLESDPYAGRWVRVARLGGWTEPASCPALIRAGTERQVLERTDWPLHFDSAKPTVWERYSDGELVYGAEMHRVEERDGVEFRPFVALFDPYGRAAWLEPVQAFVLHWGAWPKHAPDDSVTWFEEGDDSEPIEIAHWIVERHEDGTTVGRLEIRRERLLSFLATFGFDLAIYHDARLDCALAGGWRDEGQDRLRSWRVWTAAAEIESSRVTAVLRAATIIQAPPREDVLAPWDREDNSGFQYPIAVDPATGNEIRVTHPPQEFLTPVFFRDTVLERYYADPSLYQVDDTVVRAGRQWTLSIAKTGRGTVQVWLGDIAQLPHSVQQHWQPYAVLDEGGVPEWRLRRDLLAEFVATPAEGPIAELKQAIQEINRIAEVRFGISVYAKVDAMQAQSIRVLRIPANSSVDAFVQQVRALAILVVDHLNPDLFATLNAPPADGSLNRLALLVRDRTGLDEPAARDLISGLYAVQAIRSTLAAHRTGQKAPEALGRAGIRIQELPAGFAKLVQDVAASIRRLAEVLAK